MNAIRLLLVDANVIFARILADFLQQQEDLQVVGVVCNGREALEYACALRPDIVLVDPRLPGHCGQSLISHLRQTLPEMGIIVLSLFDQDSDRLLALAAGADDLVSKARVVNSLIPTLRQVVFHTSPTSLPLN